MQQTHLSDTGVGRRYSVSRATVWRWTREGNLPRPVRLGPATTRWRLADLEEWETGKSGGDAA
ncbi:MAG: AlpA family transcriptional regulator [Alcanivorax sp.]|nr:AlpA family transcriptional regulator [Alcanivorax sp.]MAY09715.1 AlpA family transcriptional regulator [Alcanivorax sp.]MBI54139.1 AlpA family transcriptional regulator [Alcanivorax sp.]HCE38790.1 AlpA family transcriptional regulator [Alcanivorax sp.]